MDKQCSINTIAPEDPRLRDASRGVLLNILQGLYPPANYRVMFGVNPDTERLHIRVMHRKVTEFRIWKWSIWRQIQPWEIIRSIEGRSYASLLRQLSENPEFLEFEIAIDGVTETSVIQAF